MSSYTVSIAASAEKHMRKIPKGYLDKIILEIADLAINPRPHGYIQLSARGECRIRFGTYRVLYFIDDKTKSVLISAVLHRKDAYK